jgi:hypothetical protein
VDVSDAARPRVVGSLDLGEAKIVALQGRLALSGSGVRARAPRACRSWTFSDPARPRELGFCPLPATRTLLALHEDILYAGTQYGGLFTFGRFRTGRAPRRPARWRMRRT